MSTRSVIAETTKDGWKGIYCHWDGYPTNRGKQIWDILHTDFIGNKGSIGVGNSGDPKMAIKAFCDTYIRGHKAGWSSFPDTCYCHEPSFVMRGDHKGAKYMRKGDFNKSWCEWAYVIDPKTATMTIYSNYGKHNEAKEVTRVNLLGKEPNWKDIEKKG